MSKLYSEITNIYDQDLDNMPREIGDGVYNFIARNKKYIDELDNKNQEIIDDLKCENAELIKFKEYFRELYGKGLEVANWHLNGKLEPFDNFYESAMELGVKEEADRLVKNSVELPCEVGDDVWIIHNDKVCLGYVRYFKIENYLKEIKLLVGISNRDYCKNNCNYFVADNLNKTWFLTREQGKQRLRELEVEE